MDRDQLDHVLRTDFQSFFAAAFDLLNPGSTLKPVWAIQAICHALHEVAAGRRLRQIINMPPRTLKSTIVSAAWPAFMLGQDPAAKIIVVSYSDDLAIDLSNKTRRIMSSQFYQRIFPLTQLSRNTNDLIETDAGGIRLATTIGGALTGFGADIIVVDDPHNATEANFEIARQRVWSFFRQTLLSRLDDPATGRIVTVMQRLHQDDLTGRLLESGGYDVLKLQAQATEQASITLSASKTHLVEIGDYLHPERLTPQILAQQRRDMGSAAFEAQYQQEPAPADGLLIKRAWLRYGDIPARGDGRVTLSFDTAVKTNPANDYSACTAWLDQSGRHFLLDVWRDKVEFPALQAKVLALATQHQPDTILIEDHGSGSSLIQTLRSHGLPVVPRKARDPKEVRLANASPYFEGGHVYLPKDAPWREVLEAELLGFPGAKHDDQVDSVSQYLGWIHERPRDIFNWDPMRDELGVDHESLAESLLWLGH